MTQCAVSTGIVETLTGYNFICRESVLQGME